MYLAPVLVSALNLANIPSSINTYERLAVWAIQCLQSIANGEEVNVIQNEPPARVAQCQVSVTADGRDRFILAAYVPLDYSQLNSGTAKTWMAASDVGTSAPHANLLSN